MDTLWALLTRIALCAGVACRAFFALRDAELKIKYLCGICAAGRYLYGGGGSGGEGVCRGGRCAKPCGCAGVAFCAGVALRALLALYALYALFTLYTLFALLSGGAALTLFALWAFYVGVGRISEAAVVAP